MGKSIEDSDRLQYKKQLADFMQQINPKPTLEEIEKLKQMYIDRRKQTSVNIEEKKEAGQWEAGETQDPSN